MDNVRARLIAAAVAVGVALASAASAAPGADVTLRVERFYDAGNFTWRLRFSGTISPAAANVYVPVLGHRCGTPFSTAVAVAGASTRADGSWQAEPGNPVIWPPATYRARWNGVLSEPVTIRIPITPVWFQKLPGRRYRVTVGVPYMRGRIVELQRLAAGRWVRVRSARLAAVRKFPGSFSATFTVRTRRLTLRILIPEASAAPCYLEATTKTWTT